MNNKMLVVLVSRLSRRKSANIIWVLKDNYEIKKTVNQISIMLQGQLKYKPATRILQLGSVTLRFITENDDLDKLCGLFIDEVIIDELQ